MSTETIVPGADAPAREVVESPEGRSTRIAAGILLALLGVTVGEITHRLARVGEADHVVVLDSGRVVQEGAPAELLAVDGPLRRLRERERG